MATQVAAVNDYLLRNTDEKDVIVVLDKSDSDCVVVSAKEWHGHLRLDVRQYWQPPAQPSNPKYKPNPDGHYVPTKQGAAIPVDQVEKLIEALVAWQEARSPGSVIEEPSQGPLTYVSGEFDQGDA